MMCAGMFPCHPPTPSRVSVILINDRSPFLTLAAFMHLLSKHFSRPATAFPLGTAMQMRLTKWLETFTEDALERGT